MEALYLALSFGVGAALAAQASANVQLSRAIRSPSAAAALQLAVAGSLLLVVALMVGLPSSPSTIEPWHLTGGLGSALYIVAGIVLFARLGAMVSVGLFIAGQMVASVILDGWGLLGLPQQSVSAVSIAGALAVVAGMAVIVRAADAPAQGSGRGRGILIGLGVIAGAGLPVQAAINAQLREALDAPFAASAVSFVVATLAMVIVFVGFTLVGSGPRPTFAGLRQMPRWGWTGGAVGASYVTITLLAVPEIGASPVIALTIAGQQLASTAVDHLGLMRLPRRPVTQLRLLGVSVLIAGTLVIQVAS